MDSRLRDAIAPSYLFLCLLLGGSAQGIWANMTLQLVGLCRVGIRGGLLRAIVCAIAREFVFDFGHDTLEDWERGSLRRSPCPHDAPRRC